MRTLHLVGLAALVSCVPAETGIDRSRILGTVMIPPTTAVEEMDSRNDRMDGAEEVPEIGWGLTVLEGTIASFDGHRPVDRVEGLGDWEIGDDADRDYFLVQTASVETLTATVTLPGAAADTRWVLEVLQESGGPRPTTVHSEWIVGSTATLEVPIESGTPYYLSIVGARGEPDQPYRFVFTGSDPNDAGVLVGAYLPAEDGGAPEAGERGRPVAGTNAGTFELQDDLSYLASWEMLLVRYVETTEPEDPDDPFAVGTTTVDEEIDTVFVYAGTWPNLNSQLPAGTFYSSEPVKAVLGDGEPADDGIFIDHGVEEPVVVDTIAPVVIGWQAEEAEPNDMVYGDSGPDLTDTSMIQDLGVLSGVGFVDIVSGTITWASAEVGWIHDIDGFSFQVAEPMQVAFTMDWPDASDLDVMIYDAEGTALDYGWYGQPEVNEDPGDVYEPDQTYYLVVLGYLAADASTEVPYELRLEPAAP